jgi:pimeloyl-ACP methyl ester carboxylesterase
MFNGREGQFESVFAREGGLDDVLHSYHEDSTSAQLFWNPRYDYKLDRRLARVNAPTLVIGVDDDRTAGNLQARRYAELLPGSEYSQIAGPDGAPSGHGVVFEQPDEVVAVLTAFTAEHAPTASASA